MSIPVLRRESSFHDAWACSSRPEEVAVREAFEAPTALENRFILKLMGDRLGALAGARVLDLGCGLGEASAYFALRGARVTAADLSASMLAVARSVAGSRGVSIETAAAAAGALPFADGSFDAVYTANTIHHLPDREALFREAHRVLRPGGWFFSWDPLAYNPAINVYRRLARDVRTEDERPLDFGVLKAARRWFPGVRFRCFWIAALLLFFKYYLLDRIDPNRERYWKLIYREGDRALWWWKPLLALDAILTRTPLVRRLAWNVVLWGRKDT